MFKKVAFILAASTLLVAAIENPAHSADTQETLNKNLGTISAAAVNCNLQLTKPAWALAEVAFKLHRDDYNEGSAAFYELGQKEGYPVACAVIMQAFEVAFATGGE